MRARTALILHELQTQLRKESTLEQLCENPAVVAMATNEELSRAQRGLIAVTVSIMQDKLIESLKTRADDLRAALEAERSIFIAMSASFVDAARGLYKLPFLQLSSSDATPPQAAEERDPISRWLTWGNVSAASAVVLLGVALFYTKAYASYKDRAESQSALIEELRKQTATLQDQRDRAIESHDVLMKEKADIEKDRDFQRTLASEMTRNAAMAATQVAAAVTENADSLKVEVATLKARVEQHRSETLNAQQNAGVFKSLFDAERKRSDAQNDALVRLNAELNKLRAQKGRS